MTTFISEGFGRQQEDFEAQISFLTEIEDKVAKLSGFIKSYSKGVSKKISRDAIPLKEKEDSSSWIKDILSSLQKMKRAPHALFTEYQRLCETPIEEWDLQCVEKLFQDTVRFASSEESRTDVKKKKLQDKLKRKAEKHTAVAPKSMTMIEQRASFAQGKGDVVAGIIKSGHEGQVFQRPVYGPLNRPRYTEVAEKVFNALCTDFESVSFEEREGALIAIVGTATYDFSTILKNIEWDQISLSQEALSRYEALLRSDKVFYKPCCFGSSDGDMEAYFARNGYKEPDGDDALPKLTLAEKLAINIFTGAAYSIINPVLRGHTELAMEKSGEFLKGLAHAELLERTVKEALLHAAVLASALKKLPDYIPKGGEDKYVWRLEYGDAQSYLEERKKAIELKGMVFQQQGFLSMSLHSPKNIHPSQLYSGVLLKNAQGKHIACFSQRPLEEEVLFFPATLQWKYVGEIPFREQPALPVFIGKTVSSPREYGSLYDFELVSTYFLTLDKETVQKEVAKLPPGIRTQLFAYIVQKNVDELQFLVDIFFSRSEALDEFALLDADAQGSLVRYALTHAIETSRKFLLLHAESLAATNQAGELIEQGVLKNNGAAMIEDLRIFFKKLAEEGPARLKGFYASEELRERIVGLKQECDKHFTDLTRRIAGQDSLNRELLTARGWNDPLRDPAVIMFLFALEAAEDKDIPKELKEFSSKILSMLFYGLVDQHLAVLETLPINSTGERDPLETYVEKKEIEKTFLPILQAIQKAFSILTKKEVPQTKEKSLFDIPYNNSKWQHYVSILQVIQKAISGVPEETLLRSFSETRPGGLARQVLDGFNLFCSSEQISPETTTIEALVEKMASSHALIGQPISHLMYDPLHLLTTLCNDTILIRLKEGEVPLRKIFEEVMRFFAVYGTVLPDHAIAAEQFWCRLLFVAEKLSSTLQKTPLLNREELFSILQSPLPQKAFASVNLLVKREEELRQELEVLARNDSLRTFLASECSFHLIHVNELKHLDYRALKSRQQEILTLLSGYWGILSDDIKVVLGDPFPSIDDICKSPDLIQRSIMLTKSYCTIALGRVVGIEVSAGGSLEDYIRNAFQVKESLRNPEVVRTIRYLNVAYEILRPLESLFKSLTSLEALDLDLRADAPITSLPDVSMFTSIRSLKIFCGSSLPTGISSLSNLQSLVIEEYSASSIPEDFFASPHLPQLRSFSISSFALTSLPEFFWAHKDLQELSISCTRFTFPKNLGTLKNLRSLSLTVNADDQQPIAHEIFQLRGLRNLVLKFQAFEEIPTEIGTLTDLEELSLVEFSKKSPTRIRLPESLGELIHLRKLTLLSDQIERLPDEIGKLQKLEELIIGLHAQEPQKDTLIHDANDLALKIAFSLKNLRKLTLGSWYSSQPFPETLWTFTLLEELTLKSFSSLPISKNIARLTKLQKLSLFFEFGEPKLPDEIWTLPNLKVLFVPRNVRYTLQEKAKARGIRLE